MTVPIILVRSLSCKDKRYLVVLFLGGEVRVWLEILRFGVPRTGAAFTKVEAFLAGLPLLATGAGVRAFAETGL